MKMQLSMLIMIAGMAATFLGCRQVEPVNDFVQFEYDFSIEQLHM
jgi:hypothetical protein